MICCNNVEDPPCKINVSFHSQNIFKMATRRASAVSNPQFSRQGVDSRARRKMSMMPPIGGAVISETASTISLATMNYAPVKYENTYKMNPDEDRKFNVKRVSDTIRILLDLVLSEYVYDSKTCGKVTCDVSNQIKQAVKDMHFARYKFVCSVVIGERKDQGLQVASRCLCDSKSDNHASATYKNNSIFAVATVHGFYYE